jgi:hypothetical protein
MAGLAEQQVRTAMRRCWSADTDVAQEVIDGDTRIDELEIEVDACGHQPAGAAAAHGAGPALHHHGHEDLQRPRARGRSRRQHCGRGEVHGRGAAVPGMPEIEEMVRLATDMLADSLTRSCRRCAVGARSCAG